MQTDKTADLWVVMPVYNERESIGRVIEEWIPVLRSTVDAFCLAIVNDGSRDNTLQILQSYTTRYPEIRVYDKANSGHGQTCLWGYRKAMEEGAEWILQIDSDGQCDPSFFPEFWKARNEYSVIFGFRRTRDDGFRRWLISRVVSMVGLVAGGVWVADANVPYRLMKTQLLSKAIENISAQFYLANILVSLRLRRLGPIHWISIHFRDRFGGTPAGKASYFIKSGKQLFRQLREDRRQASAS